MKHKWHTQATVFYIKLYANTKSFQCIEVVPQAGTNLYSLHVGKNRQNYHLTFGFTVILFRSRISLTSQKKKLSCASTVNSPIPAFWLSNNQEEQLLFHQTLCSKLKISLQKGSWRKHHLKWNTLKKNLWGHKQNISFICLKRKYCRKKLHPNIKK